MLILTRRIGEKLVVGGNVVVTILGVKGNQIRLGIDAPAEIKIHREEIFQKIQAARTTSTGRKTPMVLKNSKTPALKSEDKPVQKTRETLVLKPKKKLIGL